MMDVEVLPTKEGDLEDGELSDTSEEVYTPLQRPTSLNQTAISTTTAVTQIKCTKMDADGGVIDEEKPNIMPLNIAEEDCQSDDDDDDYSTSSGDLSDTCLDKLNKREEKKIKHKKRNIKRTVMVRIDQQPLTDSSADQKRARFKKYDIWTAALQEEALTENMRGCDVTQNALNDRNVENYDFSLKYRLNGENSLKRRLSNSNDDLSGSDQYQHHNKRQRHSSCHNELKFSAASPTSSSSSRRLVHERLGKRKDFHGRRRSPLYSGGSDSSSYDPKHIENLSDVNDREPVEVAREIANKLREQKDDLLVRIVEVLGLDLPLKIYKETQRIEAEGGMTIKNGQRRRTPGGVFLFLLKHHDSLTAEDQKAIFAEDRHNSNKRHKDTKTTMRDRKVEELKKRLCEQVVELPALSSRKDLIMKEDDSYKQNDGNLSNPPPSPEAGEHIELDLKSIPINHVTNDVDEAVSEKPSTSHGFETAKGELQAYEDDFVDVNCGDMDFF